MFFKRHCVWLNGIVNRSRRRKYPVSGTIPFNHSLDYMKRIYLIGFIALISVSNAFAGDAKDWARWAGCSVDEECVAIHDACGGWTAVNVQFKNQGEKYQNEMAPSVECLSNTKIEPEPKVLCIDHMCTVKPVGLRDMVK